VIKLIPPLIISEEDLQEGLDLLEAAIGAVAGEE
jgi:4-aminobutyrate aminotransferase-like enzyme